MTGWWFGTSFIFPHIGNNHPNWLIFFRGVETSNQMKLQQAQNMTVARHIWGQSVAICATCRWSFNVIRDVIGENHSWSEHTFSSDSGAADKVLTSAKVTTLSWGKPTRTAAVQHPAHLRHCKGFRWLTSGIWMVLGWFGCILFSEFSDTSTSSMFKNPHDVSPSGFSGIQRANPAGKAIARGCLSATCLSRSQRDCTGSKRSLFL